MPFYHKPLSFGVLAAALFALLPGCTYAAANASAQQPPVAVAQASAATVDPNASDVDTLDPSQWFPLTNEYDTFAPSPIDQTNSLDAPAGKHGFMKNADGHWVFDDRSLVSLVAVVESPIIPKDKAQADYIAHWLAKWGINMIRLHPLVEDVIDKTAADSSHLDAGAMDRLDYFVDALAKRGIYTRFSMLYYRNVKPSDGIDMVGKDKLSTMGITFFDPKAMSNNIALEKAIMTHKNPYRAGKMYGADPAICQIETTNEDSVFFYTIDSIPDSYKKELDQMWTDWLLKKYGTRDKISAAWGYAVGDGALSRLAIWEFQNPPSPSKLARAQDQLHFYYSLNSGYFNKTKDALRAAGVKQPLCGSGWIGAGNTFYTDIYSNAAGMDYIDRHHYWGGGPGDWRIVADTTKDISYTSVLQKPEEILKLSAERVMSLPYTISEESDVLPDQWRVASPAIMTFYGSGLNGWDAPIHFAHDMTYWAGDTGFTHKLYWMWPVNEPSTLCQYPALSTVTRRGDISEGPTVFVRNISEDQVFSAQPLKDAEIKIGISGVYERTSETGASQKSLAAIYAAAVGKTGIEFTKTAKPNTAVDMSKYLDMKNKRISSITGELYWDYNTGYVIANTPRTQSAVGFLNGIPVKLKDCQIKTTNKIASIIVTSWDGKPISTSRHILITAVGRSRNTGMAYSHDGHHLLEVGESPILMEGVAGTVALKRGGHCTVTALEPYGYKTAVVKPTVAGGMTTIPLSAANKAVYYDVVFE